MNIPKRVTIERIIIYNCRGFNAARTSSHHPALLDSSSTIFSFEIGRCELRTISMFHVDCGPSQRRGGEHSLPKVFHKYFADRKPRQIFQTVFLRQTGLQYLSDLSSLEDKQSGSRLTSSSRSTTPTTKSDVSIDVVFARVCSSHCELRKYCSTFSRFETSFASVVTAIEKSACFITSTSSFPVSRRYANQAQTQKIAFGLRFYLRGSSTIVERGNICTHFRNNAPRFMAIKIFKK